MVKLCTLSLYLGSLLQVHVSSVYNSSEIRGTHLQERWSAEVGQVGQDQDSRVRPRTLTVYTA